MTGRAIGGHWSGRSMGEDSKLGNERGRASLRKRGASYLFASRTRQSRRSKRAKSESKLTNRIPALRANAARYASVQNLVAHLLEQRSAFTAHQRKRTQPAFPVPLGPRQISAQRGSDPMFELSPLHGRPRFDSLEERVRYVERRFHRTIFP